jgi:hypothetical protein
MTYYKILFLILIVIIILLFIYWFSPLYKNEKFKVLLTIISVISGLVLFISIISGINIGQADAKNSKIKTYSDYSELFLSQINKLFLQNPDMMYMYNDMIGYKKINEQTKRNIDKEIVIGNIIYANAAKVAGYIYNTVDLEYSKLIKNWFVKAYTQYLKSDIFKNIYIEYYKPKLAGPLLIKIMKEEFGI